MTNSQGDFYKLCHSCPCGSGLPSVWCKDEKGKAVRACEKCKPRLLHRIFDDTFLDIVEKYFEEILLDPPPLGCEYQWEELLREKGCKQVVGLENAKRQWRDCQYLIADPEGDTTEPTHRDPPDQAVYILIPKEYANRVLAEGKLV